MSELFAESDRVRLSGLSAEYNTTYREYCDSNAPWMEELLQLLPAGSVIMHDEEKQVQIMGDPAEAAQYIATLMKQGMTRDTISKPFSKSVVSHIINAVFDSYPMLASKASVLKPAP